MYGLLTICQIVLPQAMTSEQYIMASSNGNIFSVTGPLCWEFTGRLWIRHTKASDADLWCFLWFQHWRNGSVNNREAGGLICHRAHYDVIVMKLWLFCWCPGLLFKLRPPQLPPNWEQCKHERYKIYIFLVSWYAENCKSLHMWCIGKIKIFMLSHNVLHLLA